jgi:hypothetical protein
MRRSNLPIPVCISLCLEVEVPSLKIKFLKPTTTLQRKLHDTGATADDDWEKIFI